MPDLRFIPLASSSHGNAYLLDDGKTCLLIECGVSYKKLQRLTGFGVSGIIGCLISHEHHDHAGCYEQLIKSRTEDFEYYTSGCQQDPGSEV